MSTYTLRYIYKISRNIGIKFQYSQSNEKCIYIKVNWKCKHVMKGASWVTWQMQQVHTIETLKESLGNQHMIFGNT